MEVVSAPCHQKNDNYTVVVSVGSSKRHSTASTRVYVCNIIKLTEAIISVCCRNEHVKGGASVTLRWKMREDVCIFLCRSGVQFTDNLTMSAGKTVSNICMFFSLFKNLEEIWVVVSQNQLRVHRSVARSGDFNFTAAH